MFKFLFVACTKAHAPYNFTYDQFIGASKIRAQSNSQGDGNIIGLDDSIPNHVLKGIIENESNTKRIVRSGRQKTTRKRLNSGRKFDYGKMNLQDIPSIDRDAWIESVDSDHHYRGDKEVLVVPIRFAKSPSARDADFVKYSARILDTMLNFDNSDCTNGGGYYDNHDLDKALGDGAERFILGYENKYISVKNIFKAESFGQFIPHFHIIDSIIDVNYNIENCAPWLGCGSIIKDIVEAISERYQECLEDTAPNGNKWHTDIYGNRTIALFFDGSVDKTTMRSFQGSVDVAVTRKRDNTTVHFYKYAINTLFRKDCQLSVDYCTNELATTGVMIHEFGHLLFGLPDLYDYSYESYGAGYYDTMAWTNGSNDGPLCEANIEGSVNSGQRIQMMSAVSRVWLGWSWPVNLYENKSYVLEDVYQNVMGRDGCLPPKFDVRSVLVHNDTSLGFTEDELYAIEYRTASNIEPCLPGGGGLMIFHADGDVQQHYNASYPGFNDFPNVHYRLAVVQADGRYDMEKNRNKGDASDIHRPGDIPLDINTLVEGELIRKEAHEVLSPYKRMGDYSNLNLQLRDLRSLSITTYGKSLLASLIVNDDSIGYGVRSDLISNSRLNEFWKAYGDTSRAKVVPNFRDTYIYEDIANWAEKNDYLCVDAITRVFENPQLHQQCVMLRFNPSIASCLIDCVEQLQPSLKETCSRKGDTECSSIMPAPDVDPIECDDYVEATEGSIWSDRACKQTCFSYGDPIFTEYCHEILNYVMPGVKFPDNIDSPWVQARCFTGRTQYEGTNYCEMVPGCETMDNPKCPIK